MRVSKLVLEKLGCISTYEDRQTGQTTAIALQAISSAMMNPDNPIKIKDHYDSLEADKNAFDLTRRLVDKLELRFFTFDRHLLTIIYQPFVDVIL